MDDGPAVRDAEEDGRDDAMIDSELDAMEEEAKLEETPELLLDEELLIVDERVAEMDETMDVKPIEEAADAVEARKETDVELRLTEDERSAADDVSTVEVEDAVGERAVDSAEEGAEGTMVEEDKTSGKDLIVRNERKQTGAVPSRLEASIVA